MDVIDTINNLPAVAKERLLLRLATEMQQQHPDTLQALVERAGGPDLYKDYLAEQEARLVTDSFVNFDGSTGAHWPDAEAVFGRIAQMGGEVDSPGRWNRWAAFAVLNMIYSDYGGVLREYADGDRFVRLCWQLAQALLEDTDRDEGVRWYFQLDD